MIVTTCVTNVEEHLFLFLMVLHLGRLGCNEWGAFQQFLRYIEIYNCLRQINFPPTTLVTSSLVSVFQVNYGVQVDTLFQRCLSWHFTG